MKVKYKAPCVHSISFYPVHRRKTGNTEQILQKFVLADHDPRLTS